MKSPEPWEMLPTSPPSPLIPPSSLYSSIPGLYTLFCFKLLAFVHAVSWKGLHLSHFLLTNCSFLFKTQFRHYLLQKVLLDTSPPGSWNSVNVYSVLPHHCNNTFPKDTEVKSLSHVQLFATPWTVAQQAPPSMGFSKQEYWSGLPLPSPEDLPDPGIEPRSPAL